MNVAGMHKKINVIGEKKFSWVGCIRTEERTLIKEKALQRWN